MIQGRVVFAPHGRGFRLDVLTIDGRLLASTFDMAPLRLQWLWAELDLVCQWYGRDLSAPQCEALRGDYRCALGAGHAGACAFHGWAPQATGFPVDTHRFPT